MSIDPRGLAAAVIESQRVEYSLRALGYDVFGRAKVMQEIADLYQSTTLSWHDAAEQVMERIASGLP